MITTTNRTFTISIDGMTCGHCVQAVIKVLSAVPGVKVHSVTVGSAEIEAADGWAVGKAVTAVEEAGYGARVPDDPAVAAQAPAKNDGVCCGGKTAPGTASSHECCG